LLEEFHFEKVRNDFERAMKGFQDGLERLLKEKAGQFGLVSLKS